MKIEERTADALQLHECVRLGADKEFLHYLCGNIVNLDKLVNGVTVLSLAVVHENETALQMLLKAGANANLSSVAEDCIYCRTRQEPPIVTAARMGHTQLVEMLLKHGADANGMERDTGETALIWATRDGNLAMVEVLVSHGAFINMTDFSQRSPLYLTASNGYWKIATYLITHGANLNICGEDNESALMIAIILRQPKMARLLIRIGANVNTHDSDTNDPLAWAILTGDIGISKLLVIAGAIVTERHLLTIKETDICDDSLLCWLNQYTKTPPSLIHSCRLAIRKYLMMLSDDKDIDKTISSLPLPKRIKNFLALRTY